MDLFLQDVRYAVRSLRRQPSFAALAILTLALGIGANAAMFAVVDGVLLRPLRYPHPARIVSLVNFWTKRGTTGSVSGPDFHDWHDTASSFDAMAYYTFTSDNDISVGANGTAGFTAAALVSAEFFNVFETPAIVGRTFSTADAAVPLAVISHEFWIQRFNGRSDVVGQAVAVGGRSVRIVGVMPAGFAFPGHTQLGSRRRSSRKRRRDPRTTIVCWRG